MVGKRKGASTLVIVFIILTISLISITWFRANTSSGTGTQQDLVQKSQITSLNHRFKNAQLYLENSIFYAGQKGSYKSANYSGRTSKNPEARYWTCNGNKQIPSIKQIRYSTSNFTEAKLENRTKEIHGIRDQTVYEVGDISCIETGYQTPMEAENNSKFTQGLEIKSLNATTRNGELRRSVTNFTASNEILYNRYWYMYSTLKKWVENAETEEKVTSELKTVQDYSSNKTTMCIESSDQCEYPSTYMCSSNHRKELRKAVADGIDKEIERLETQRQFFNGSEVECSWASNKDRSTNARYPGIQVKLNSGTSSKNITEDGEGPCGTTGSGDPKWNYQCKKSWDLDFTAVADFTVTCRDKKYRMVPEQRGEDGKRKNMKWKIDISFTTQETEENKHYTENFCSPGGVIEPGTSYPPISTNTCNYNSNPQTCQTQVKTVN